MCSKLSGWFRLSEKSSEACLTDSVPGGFASKTTALSLVRNRNPRCILKSRSTPHTNKKNICYHISFCSELNKET